MRKLKPSPLIGKILAEIWGEEENGRKEVPRFAEASEGKQEE